MTEYDNLIIIQDLFFIVALTTEALLLSKHASTRIFHDSCDAQGSNKRNALYISILIFAFPFVLYEMETIINMGYQHR
jgi:hypothetical protein